MGPIGREGEEKKRLMTGGWWWEEEKRKLQIIWTLEKFSFDLVIRQGFAFLTWHRNLPSIDSFSTIFSNNLILPHRMKQRDSIAQAANIFRLLLNTSTHRWCFSHLTVCLIFPHPLPKRVGSVITERFYIDVKHDAKKKGRNEQESLSGDCF